MLLCRGLELRRQMHRLLRMLMRFWNVGIKVLRRGNRSVWRSLTFPSVFEAHALLCSPLTIPRMYIRIPRTSPPFPSTSLAFDLAREERVRHRRIVVSPLRRQNCGSRNLGGWMPFDTLDYGPAPQRQPRDVFEDVRTRAPRSSPARTRRPAEPGSARQACIFECNAVKWVKEPTRLVSTNRRPRSARSWPISLEPQASVV